MTFIADERFQSFYVENTGLWTLQIKYVQVSFPFFARFYYLACIIMMTFVQHQARDAGLYECQVSTEPKVSARVHLHVVGECLS